MSEDRKDRRGERRNDPWGCQNIVWRGGLATACGAGPDARAETVGTGVVYCTKCGRVDRRGTRGNRRQARDELGALQRRIERDMESFDERLERAEAATVESAREALQAGHNAREALRVAEDARHDAEAAKRTAADAVRSY